MRLAHIQPIADRKLQLTQTMHTSRNSNRSALRLVQLETRDAPATLVGANKVTYQDVDGDNVTVTLSKPVLTAANVNSVFNFDAGTVNGSNATNQQLEGIDLVPLGQSATGLGIAMSAMRSSANGGDGFAALGHISANGIDLGAIIIDGDLGRIIAGDAVSTTPGATSLKAHTIGRYSTSTGAPNLNSMVTGKLGSFLVKSDIRNAQFYADGFGAITIGGSLIGGAAANSGRMLSGGDIGLVKIAGDIVGGNGANSGSIQLAGAVSGVTIGGSLRGGLGDQSGVIFSTGAMGALKITGNVVGGSGLGSGSIGSGGQLTSVTIGGSVLGGGGDYSGRVNVANGLLGTAKITGDVVGGSGVNSGEISTNGALTSLTIGGSVLGGDGMFSGRVASVGAMGAVKVKGDVAGSSGIQSGMIFANAALAGATIGGSLRGGAGNISGQIYSGGAIGAVKITGDMVGGDGAGSAMIASTATLAGVTIGGSLRGGAGQDSGRIFSTGAMGAVKISGSVIGGSGQDSAEIDTNNNLTSVTIGGSLRGGIGPWSGRIYADGAIGALKITGDLVGGSASGADALVESGYIQAKRIASLTLGGSLIAGTDNTSGTYFNNGAVRVVDDLGLVLIKGSIVGNVTNPAIISARGSAAPTPTSDIAIASLTVLGRMEFAQVLAGWGTNAAPKNADAQIGAVIVGGSWFASSIAAGALPGGNGYGSGDTKMAGAGVKDEATLSSRIASTSIGGQALGTVGGSTHFGIVAEIVGAAKVAGTSFLLTAGASNDDFLVGITGDFRVNEV
jgi:hypothetical protein